MKLCDVELNKKSEDIRKSKKNAKICKDLQLPHEHLCHWSGRNGCAGDASAMMQSYSLENTQVEAFLPANRSVVTTACMP